MKLRYIYIIVLCILTSGCNYLDIMPDERAKLEDSYNTPSKTEGFLYSCYTYMPMNRTSQDSQPYQSWYPTALLTGGEVTTYYKANEPEQLLSLIHIFPAPKHAFYYLEDRKKGDPGLDTTPPDVGYFTQFAEDMKITKQITYTISGHQVNVQNGEQAVAFEIKENDNLKYFGTSFQFEVPNTISPDRVKLYAVQADGVRIEMTRK